MEIVDLILETEQPLSKSQIVKLKELGLRLVEALGLTAYRIRGQTNATLFELENLDYVVAVRQFPAASKMDRALQLQMAQATAMGAGLAAGEVLPDLCVLVDLDTQADVGATLEKLNQIAHIEEQSARRVRVTVNPTRLEEVVNLSGVLAAEVEPENRIYNNVARQLSRIEPIATTFGLDGAGEVIGVADSGLDTGILHTLSADFAGRVLKIRATVNKTGMGVAHGADLNNHGTHVCGSILGSGALSNGQITGMAPAAQLTMLAMGPDSGHSLEVPSDLTAEVFRQAYADGARIHSNSWGSAITGVYTAYSKDVDQFVRDHPDMFILFAAGNAGLNGPQTVTPPGTAKNCLTVGAAKSVRPLPATATLRNNLQDTDFNPSTPKVNDPLSLEDFDQEANNHDEIADFSSRGPTNSRRIKPDMVAPGTWILSCRSSVSLADVGPDGLPYGGWLASQYADDADGVETHAEAVGSGLPGGPIFGTWDQVTPPVPLGSGAHARYLYTSGTSMATPIVAGAAALLRQYLRKVRGQLNPSAALLKALLINGATVPAGESNAPNNARGFGWLNLENTLAPQPAGEQVFFDDVNLAVAQDEVRTFTVRVSDKSHPFRCTLVWTDEPGEQLQNRLYLRVFAPDGTVFNGDVKAFPRVTHNTQRVHIDEPTVGVYRIEVHGVSVMFGIAAVTSDIRQDFALAIINGVPSPAEPATVL